MSKFRLLSAASIGVLFAFSMFSTSMANETGDLDGDAMLITTGDPEDPKFANAGDNLRTGVGSIFIEFHGIPVGGYICTATVIDDHHILTAAHCVREAGDTVRRVRLVLNAGLAAPMIIDAESFSVHPWYDLFSGNGYGAFSHGDLAVIRMPNPLPPEIERYNLYTTFDEAGKETRHYGHGVSGKGIKGATGTSDFFYARTGLNTYEQTLQPLLGDGIEDQLLHDFDSGGSKHNAMEWWFTSSFACHPENPNNPPQAQDGQCTTFKDGSYPDFTGFGKFEAGISPGDSGGPGFIDGMIAGVHSFGFTHFCAGVTNGTDFSCGLNSSYGEMSGDTSVAYHQGWINAAAGGLGMTTIPEIAAVAAAGSGTEMIAEMSANGKAFAANTFSRTLRAPITFEEVKEKFDLE